MAKDDAFFDTGSEVSNTALRAFAENVVNLIRAHVPGETAGAMSDRAMVVCYVLAKINGVEDYDPNTEDASFRALVDMTLKEYRKTLYKGEIN